LREGEVGEKIHEERMRMVTIRERIR